MGTSSHVGLLRESVTCAPRQGARDVYKGVRDVDIYPRADEIASSSNVNQTVPGAVALRV